MNNVSRKIELHRVCIARRSDNEDYDENIILMDLLSSFFNNNKFTESNNKYFDINSTRRFWINDVYCKNNTIKLKLDYAIHNKKVDIININTKAKVNQKDFSHGDQEKQHILIDVLPETNCAVLVFEKIHSAITITAIKNAIRKYLYKYIHDNYKDIIKPRSIRLDIEPIASTEFIEEIMALKGISVIKTIVHKEKIKMSDEDLIFSGPFCRDETELIFRPNPKNRLIPSDVAKYCEAFINNGKIKDERVKRIIIEGNNESNRIRLDSDGMKLCENIKASLDIDHTVDSDAILNQFESILNTKKDYLINFMDITISEPEYACDSQ